MVLQILENSGLSILGVLIYAFFTVRKKIKEDGFSGSKFFNENVPFWAITISLNILLCIAIVVAPDFAELVGQFIAIESTTKGGFIILGMTLAAGSDNTIITGKKTLTSKVEEE